MAEKRRLAELGRTHRSKQRCLAKRWRLRWKPVQWSPSLPVRLISLLPMMFNCRRGSIEGVIVLDYLGVGLSWESGLSYH